MLRFTELAKHPRKLYRMTGVTVEQFQTLTTRLSPLWTQAEHARLSRRQRRHAIGQGRKYTLAPMADKLLCLLAFDRFALTDERLGWLVGLDASTVCRLQQRLEPLLAQAADPALGLSLRRRLPPGAKKIGTWEKLLAVCPEFAEIMTDATEQPRQRPPRRSQRRWDLRHTEAPHGQDPEYRQRSRPDPAGECACAGPRTHDDALFKRAGTADKVPRAAQHDLDRGYDGAPSDYPDQHVIVPVTRRRNHRRFTRLERRFTRLQARRRLIVEHVFSRLKKYQVLAPLYRHRITDYNRRFRPIAALANLRLATTVT